MFVSCSGVAILQPPPSCPSCLFIASMAPIRISAFIGKIWGKRAGKGWPLRMKKNHFPIPPGFAGNKHGLRRKNEISNNCERGGGEGNIIYYYSVKYWRPYAGIFFLLFFYCSSISSVLLFISFFFLAWLYILTFLDLLAWNAAKWSGTEKGHKQQRPREQEETDESHFCLQRNHLLHEILTVFWGRSRADIPSTERLINEANQLVWWLQVSGWWGKKVGAHQPRTGTFWIFLALFFFLLAFSNDGFHRVLSRRCKPINIFPFSQRSPCP